MKLVERFWATFCQYLNFIALSSFSHDADGGIQQYHLFEDSHQVSEDPHLDPLNAPGPIFKPPGGALEGDGSNFTCDYTAMTGWSQCSTADNRRCWLRHLYGGEYSVSTDYEKWAPKGIVREYWLTVGPGEIHADGQPFYEAKLVNNTYPGPWIQACWGDQVIVHVTVDEGFHNGTAIHWHGIRQNHTMHMDGVPGITQCPIAPGSSFKYNFTATQYGSSWYHSHYSLQYADGMLGPLTIHGPSTAAYDEAGTLPLLITDYDHASAFNVIYNSKKYSNNPTILLSGRGNVEKCNPGVKATEDIPDPTTVTFEAGKKYLLRIINTAYDSTFLFSIDNHELTVVSADFVPIVPYKVDQVHVGIGQRYNIIVEAKPLSDGSNPIQDSGNYWIRTHVLSECFGKAPAGPNYNEIGILRYNSSSADDPKSKQWADLDTDTCIGELEWKPFFSWTVGEQWNQKEQHDIQLLPRLFTKTYISTYPLNAFALATPSPIPVTLQPLRVDYEDITFQHLDNTGGWPDPWVVISEDGGYDKWVYLAITDHTNSRTKAHPIHLHGHDFAILAQHNYPYDPNNFTLVTNNPPRRDVVLLPTGGYVVIAFKTDNPGAWLMHCHIARHASEGLALQIMEDRELANGIWPKGDSEALAIAEELCGNWTNWMGDCNNQWNGKCNEWFQDDSGI